MMIDDDWRDWLDAVWFVSVAAISVVVALTLVAWDARIADSRFWDGE